MAKSRSTTISTHTDEYLDLLCEQYGISKSSLMADLIDLGLNVFVTTMLNRNKLENQLKNGFPEVEYPPKEAARQDKKSRTRKDKIEAVR